MRRCIKFQYRSLWCRLIACLGTANVVWYAFGGRAMEIVEQYIYEVLLRFHVYGIPELPSPYDTMLVYALCLLPAIPRFDRPLALIGCGLATGGAYILVAGLAYLAMGIFLPVAGPALGLVTSVVVLGTMAWSEERSRRRELHALDLAKQRFTDMLVHDLKSRVSSIRISTSLLEREVGRSSDKVGTLLDAIHASSARMLLQINALLDIRKMQEGRMELHRQPVSILSLLRASLAENAPLAELCGVNIREPDPQADNALIDADVEVVSRVLANLLWNALRNSPRKGTVMVSTWREGPLAHISIANGGAAIPSAEKEELFQPFVSYLHSTGAATGSGTGLGLAFCKLAVEAHGGRIRLDSPRMPEGDGVKVTVSFPASVL